MKHLPRFRELFFCVAVGGGPLKTADQWLRFSEDQIRGQGSSAVIEMEIKTENWTRTLELTADARGKKEALVFIQSPAKEKGIGTLRLDQNMWNWFPKLKRQVVVSPSMLLASWMGSDFTNDDLLKASSLAEDYHHAFLPDEKLGGVPHKVIENTAKSDAKVMWPKIITLSSKKDCLPREQRYYDKKGALIRVLKLSDVATFDGHKVPRTWVMTPLKDQGKTTRMYYKQLKFRSDFPTRHFSQQTLTGN